MLQNLMYKIKRTEKKNNEKKGGNLLERYSI